MKPLPEWTPSDAAKWLRTSQMHAKYAENELEGVNGNRLLLATDGILMRAGIDDPEDRQELLRSINLVTNQYAEREALNLSDSEQAKADAAADAFARVGLTPPEKRPVQDAQLITPAHDGTLTLEPLGSGLGPGARSLAEQLYLVHGAAVGAYYNRGNCLALAARAARLLAAAMEGGRRLPEDGTFAADFGEALAEIRDFVSTFSQRGWLTRLTAVEGDREEFERLERGLGAVALKHGLLGESAEPVAQVYTEDTQGLRAVVEAAGGLQGLQGEHSMRAALQAIEPLLSEAAADASEELVGAEIASLEAERSPGGHWAIRNADVRLFWWAAFADADETTWERFWSKFPKHLQDKKAQSGIMAIVTSKRNRDTLQHRANRGSPQIATSVELDFMYPPQCDILGVTSYAIKADLIWLELTGRSGATLENDQVIQSALPLLPEDYVPDVACVQAICTRLRKLDEPLQVVQIVGDAGQGKLTTAIAVARHAVMTLHWTTGYCAPFQGVTSIAECKFQLLAAFGIPAASQDMSPLHAWLHREAGTATELSGTYPIGLVMHNIDGMLQDATMCQHFTDIIAKILEVAPQLQIVTTSQQEWTLPSNLRVFKWQAHDWSLQQAAEGLSYSGDKAKVEGLPTICTRSPLLLRIVSRALTRGDLSAATLFSEVNAAGNTWSVDRCVRMVLKEISEDLLMALLYLSVFPLSFDVAGAAEVLAMPLLHSRAAATLNALHGRGLLEYHAPREKYWLHPVVKAVIVGIAADVGFSCNTARLAFVEHYGAVLQRIGAVHTAGAPRAAMKLFGDEHLNLYELVKWARSGPPPESAPVYSDLLWTCVDVLSVRMDEGEKQAFCEACLETGRQLGDGLMQGRALWQLGRLEGHRGQHERAAALKLAALQRLERVLGPDHLDVAKCCTGLGKTHCALYKYPEAEDFYGRAYAIQSDALGSEHPEVLRTMTAHASVLLILGRFSHAEEVYRTVLDMREKALGLNDPQVAESLSHVGQLLQRLGRCAEAEPILRRAVKIEQEQFGDTHLQVAKSLSNLASLLNDVERYEEAEKAYRASLSIREDALGETNVQVAEGFAELADLLRKQCLFDSAHSYAQQAVSVLLRTDLAAAVRGQCLLSRILCDAGRYPEARVVGQAALDALSSQSAVDKGPELADPRPSKESPELAHAITSEKPPELADARPSEKIPELADALEAVAHAAQLLGTPEELQVAAEHTVQALRIREALFGGSSLEVAACQHMLATIYLKMDRHAEAERACNTALNIREGVCAVDDQRVADSLCTLSAVALARRRYDVAEDSAERCLRIRKRSCAANNLKVAEAQLARARVLLALERWPEAEREAELCVSLRRRKLTMKHPATAEAVAVCAEIFLAAGRLAEAKTQADKAAALYCGTLGAEHPQTVAAKALARRCSPTACAPSNTLDPIPEA